MPLPRVKLTKLDKITQDRPVFAQDRPVFAQDRPVFLAFWPLFLPDPSKTYAMLK